MSHKLGKKKDSDRVYESAIDNEEDCEFYTVNLPNDGYISVYYYSDTEMYINDEHSAYTFSKLANGNYKLRDTWTVYRESKWIKVADYNRLINFRFLMKKDELKELFSIKHSKLTQVEIVPKRFMLALKAGITGI